MPVTAGGESHTLTFEGEKDSARLVLKSRPQLPSRFLRDKAAEVRPTPPADAPQTISTVEGMEGGIRRIQLKLIRIDNNKQPTATGAAGAEADVAATELDTELGKLATTVSAAVNKWHGVQTPLTPADVQLSRGSFSAAGLIALANDHIKRGIAQAAQMKMNTSKDARKHGHMINLDHQFGSLARRHVVSSSDMIGHYQTTLAGKTVTEAKMYLEQRASVPEARTPVAKLDVPGVKQALSTRYDKFFNLTRNLFIGDQAANNVYSFRLDRDHPDMSSITALNGHVKRIKRSWAFDQGFTPNGWTDS